MSGSDISVLRPQTIQGFKLRILSPEFPEFCPQNYVLVNRDRQSQRTGTLCVSALSVHGTAEGGDG